VALNVLASWFTGSAHQRAAGLVAPTKAMTNRLTLLASRCRPPSARHPAMLAARRNSPRAVRLRRSRGRSATARGPSAARPGRACEGARSGHRSLLVREACGMHEPLRRSPEMLDEREKEIPSRRESKDPSRRQAGLLAAWQARLSPSDASKRRPRGGDGARPMADTRPRRYIRSGLAY
jgi:hypothetical protein